MFLYMSILERQNVYTLAGINKEIFRDLFKVNAGMIDTCTVGPYKVPGKLT